MGGFDPGVPAGGAAVAGRFDRREVESGAGEKPGDDRVRVPHLAEAELVATPCEEGDGGKKGEDAARRLFGAANAAGALDRVCDVRDLTVGPGVQLIAEEAQRAEEGRADGALADDAATHPTATGDRGQLDREAALGGSYLEGRVVEVERGTAGGHRDEALVRLTAVADDLAAGAEWQPVEVDRPVPR
jgi:hypothetical protein